MADSNVVAGYPVGPFERFVNGFESGYADMTDIRKKSMELKERQAFADAAEDRMKRRAGGDESSGQGREGAYDTGGTTGSGGSGGSGSGGGDGSISSFDSKQNGTGHVVSKGERIEYYNQLAKEYGLNAHAILMTIDKEGLHSYVGDNGKSFGDFQMYTGGGMGNEALRAGINIRDPNTWREQAQYAMKQMAAHKGDAKWFAGQWHGPANHAPWAVRNFSNLDATPPSGGGARPMSAGSSAPVPGAPVQVGGPGSEGAGSSAPAPAPAEAPAPAPAALNLSEVGTRSLGNAGLGGGGVSRPFMGRPTDLGAGPRGANGLAPMTAPPPPPQQQSALGGPPGGQPMPDIYNRPQAPPPPSVLAQLAQQYLPKQNAALAPRGPNDLYSGLA